MYRARLMAWEELLIFVRETRFTLFPVLEIEMASCLKFVEARLSCVGCVDACGWFLPTVSLEGKAF